MKFLRLFFIIAVGCFGLQSNPCFAESKIKVVSTTTVLADFAKQMGGDLVEVYYVASPKRDLHKVSPTPRDVLKTKKADVVIYHGLQAEPWLLPLLNAAGKSEFMQENGKAIDASEGIQPLEVPDKITRLEGDIHPHGNPHYWLDPQNGKRMAEKITEGFVRIFPNLSTEFRKNNQVFQEVLDQKLRLWQKRMQPFKGAAVVTYHRSWSYFAQRYGLEVVGEIEPKPGIPVTSKHLNQLITRMKETQAKLLIKEPYQETKALNRLAKVSQAQVVELHQFSGAQKGVHDYLSLIEYNITQIEEAFARGEV